MALQNKLELSDVCGRQAITKETCKGDCSGSPGARRASRCEPSAGRRPAERPTSAFDHEAENCPSFAEGQGFPVLSHFVVNIPAVSTCSEKLTLQPKSPMPGSGGGEGNKYSYSFRSGEREGGGDQGFPRRQLTPGSHICPPTWVHNSPAPSSGGGWLPCFTHVETAALWELTYRITGQVQGVPKVGTEYSLQYTVTHTVHQLLVCWNEFHRFNSSVPKRIPPGYVLGPSGVREN